MARGQWISRVNQKVTKSLEVSRRWAGDAPLFFVPSTDTDNRSRSKARSICALQLGDAGKRHGEPNDQT